MLVLQINPEVVCNSVFHSSYPQIEYVFKCNMYNKYKYCMIYVFVFHVEICPLLPIDWF